MRWRTYREHFATKVWEHLQSHGGAGFSLSYSPHAHDKDVAVIGHLRAAAILFYDRLDVLNYTGATNNVFPQQDTILSAGIIGRMVAAMTPFDAGANHRARVAYNVTVASDLYNGNTAAYCPVRTAYIEVDFIDYGAQTTTPNDDLVDILLNTGPNAAAVKTAVVNAMKDGITNDLLYHQPQPE